LPVRGAGTSTGLGLGDGVDDGVGRLVVALTAGESEAELVDGLGVRPASLEPMGDGVVGEQPTSKTAQAIASPTRRPWLPGPITPRRIADAAKRGPGPRIRRTIRGRLLGKFGRATRGVVPAGG
jgi:hypothetical protein